MAIFSRRRSEPPQLVTTPARADALAIRISQAELEQIERMLDAAWNLTHRYGTHEERNAESPVSAMMKALRMRAGAAVAAAEHAGVEADGAIPFFEHEVETVETAYRTLVADRGAGMFTEHEKQLVDQLHARLGYAAAVCHLGPLPVFREQLPR
ncbi:hypothetical protein [Amycolatopsis sp. NBC_01480]|uniref:hypothetical protein n=1 Tax=Amycolatopsis sp. NBC_01480 TaxID=2903562 RepID=UPI002E2C4499|nr:hypothetical protein [Amycolatopsis sp. NBC_01480]